MIRMSGDGFGQATTRAPRVWSLSSAPCPCDWTTAGTRSSSTSPISRGGPMAPTTSRRSGCRWDEGRVPQLEDTGIGYPLPFKLEPFASICKNIYVKYLCALFQIHANCRIRRVYFSDRLYSEDELPAEFKLYLPVQNKAKVSSVFTGQKYVHDLNGIAIVNSHGQT